MNGTVIFQRSRAPIVNGEKVVTNERTLEGSKLLRLAKLPNPKKESSVKKRKKYERRNWRHGEMDGEVSSNCSSLIHTASVTSSSV